MRIKNIEQTKKYIIVTFDNNVIRTIKDWRALKNFKEEYSNDPYFKNISPIEVIRICTFF